MNRRDLIRTLSGGVAGIPAVASIERLALSKEDTLVVTYERMLNMESMERIKVTFEKHFPGVKVLVLDGGAQVKAIRKA